MAQQVEATAEQATLTTDAAPAEVFLRADSGEVLRLRWELGQEQEHRVLPAGTYRFLGYRLLREGWIASAAAGRESLEFEPGSATTLEIDPSVRVNLRSRQVQDKLTLSLSIKGHGDMGLSLYEDGQRIPLPWAITDAAGAVRAKGKLNYG